MPFTVALVGALLLVSPWFSNALLGVKILHFVVEIGTYFLTRRQYRAWWLAALAISAVGVVVTDGRWQVVPLTIWAAVVWSSSQPVHSLGHLPARVLGSRFLFGMGEISYSIYLLHMIPPYTSLYLVGRAGVAGD